MSKVEIYTTPWCPYCTRAKELLDKKGIAYDEIDVEATKGSRDTMTKRAGGRTSVPQIFINGQHIGGCDDLMMLDANNELDELLGEKLT